MARIRSAKPSWWNDRKLAALSRDCRFTFKGIIEVLCDDEGRFQADPALVKAGVWPYDDDLTPKQMEKCLSELEQLGRTDDEPGRIVRYVVNGESYGWVPRFLTHQRISNPTASKLPAPPETAQGFPKAPASSAGESVAPPLDVGAALAHAYSNSATALGPDIFVHFVRSVIAGSTTRKTRLAAASAFLSSAEKALKLGATPAQLMNAAEDYIGALTTGRETPSVGRWRGYIGSAVKPRSPREAALHQGKGSKTYNRIMKEMDDE